MQLEVHSVLLILQESMPGMAVIAFLSSLCFSKCFTGVCNVGSCWCESVELLFYLCQGYCYVDPWGVTSWAWYMCT